MGSLAFELDAADVAAFDIFEEDVDAFGVDVAALEVDVAAFGVGVAVFVELLRRDGVEGPEGVSTTPGPCSLESIM